MPHRGHYARWEVNRLIHQSWLIHHHLELDLLDYILFLHHHYHLLQILWDVDLSLDDQHLDLCIHCSRRMIRRPYFHHQNHLY